MTAVHVTAAQLASVMQVPKSTVLRQAEAAGWQYTEEPGRGGLRRLYLVEQLPAALRAKLCSSEKVEDLHGLIAGWQSAQVA